jgi:hypothetical protein
MRSRHTHLKSEREDLISFAWREWRDNASYRGQALDSLEVDPPKWFKLVECGFALDAGPSLRWTCESLARATRAALKMLGRDAPLKITYPKDFTRDPRARRRHPTRARQPRAETTSQVIAGALARHGVRA